MWPAHPYSLVGLIQLALGVVPGIAAKGSVAGAHTIGATQLDVLIMADIGHSREHADRLTTPSFVMGKSAFEGAFSLYDGLADFVVNQGMRPEAVIIAGDVAYGGGSADVLNDTQCALQKYMAGRMAPERVFPLIGNHDLNYFGCMIPSPPEGLCYYGGRQRVLLSAPDLNFTSWRENWLKMFPGLNSTIAPAGSVVHSWLPPLRYNLDLKPESGLYFIMGLITGAKATRWGPGTPVDAVDALSPGGIAIECAFLRDSLAHGRKLGKAIFIYVTHDFNRACDNWELIKQVDVWIYGHVHNAWQSPALGEVLLQEQRHYPVRLLIGNGGFDNGLIDAVGFGRLQEELVVGAGNGGEDRIRLHFTMYDTCLSTKPRCPSYNFLPADIQCWKRCQDIPGGYDGGGGPRKATPSSHRLGFTLDAPRRPLRPTAPSPGAPLGGSWRLSIQDGTLETTVGWLALGSCGITQKCLLVAPEEDAAATFTFFDVSVVSETGAQKDEDMAFSARIAVVGDPIEGLRPSGRGPLKKYNDLLHEGATFWDKSLLGTSSFQPSEGHRFRFSFIASRWIAKGITLRRDMIAGNRLAIDDGMFLDVSFHRVRTTDEEVIV